MLFKSHNGIGLILFGINFNSDTSDDNILISAWGDKFINFCTGKLYTVSKYATHMCGVTANSMVSAFLMMRLWQICSNYKQLL